jgi:hypothetical protein
MFEDLEDSKAEEQELMFAVKDFEIALDKFGVDSVIPMLKSKYREDILDMLLELLEEEDEGPMSVL